MYLGISGPCGLEEFPTTVENSYTLNFLVQRTRHWEPTYVISNNTWSSLLVEEEILISPWENFWVRQQLLYAQLSGFSFQLFFFKEMTVQAVQAAWNNGAPSSFQSSETVTITSSDNVFHEISQSSFVYL